MTKKRRVVATAEATADIESIGEYVARDRPYQAARLLVWLNRAIDELAMAAEHYPVIVVRGDDAIRRRVVGSYNVLYWTREDSVEIVHVVHGARNLKAVLFPED